MNRYAFALTSAASILLAGCGDGSRTPATAPEAKPANSANMAIERDVATLKEDASIAAVNKRLDELEAEVSALKTNSQTIEIDLLKQRLQAVESTVYARDDYRGAAAGTGQPAISAPSVGTAPKLPAAKPVAPRKVSQPGGGTTGAKPSAADKAEKKRQ